MADLLRKIDAVVREQNALRARRVSIWLGALSHMSPSHVREHFVCASRGTAGEGAELDIEVSDDVADPRAQVMVLRSVELDVADKNSAEDEDSAEVDAIGRR